MQDAGVGPAPVARRALRGDRFGPRSTIDRLLTDDGLRVRAEALGKRMRTEDGVATAVEILVATTGPGPLTATGSSA